MKLTKQFLEVFGACEAQSERFNKLYPNGCELTVTNLAILASTTYKNKWDEYHFFDICWLGEQLMYINYRLHQQWLRLFELIDNENGELQHETDVAILGVLLNEVTEERFKRAMRKMRPFQGAW